MTRTISTDSPNYTCLPTRGLAVTEENRERIDAILDSVQKGDRGLVNRIGYADVLAAAAEGERKLAIVPASRRLGAEVHLDGDGSQYSKKTLSFRSRSGQARLVRRSSGWVVVALVTGWIGSGTKTLLPATVATGDLIRWAGFDGQMENQV